MSDNIEIEFSVEGNGRQQFILYFGLEV